MYDKDGSGEVDLEEMVEIFVLVYGMQVTQPTSKYHSKFLDQLYPRLLTNRGSDRSGSCLILIRQPPD